jgi:hypothetical protein
MKRPLYVTNFAGETEPLSLHKIYHSARRAGASKALARKISEAVRGQTYPYIPTQEIARRTHALLKRELPSVALRFNLKEALRKLGPSGFPFEKYIGEILRHNGYQVQLNLIISGVCVDYEIDFLAQKNKTLLIGECKYHHLPGGKVDLKVVLANYARFLDLVRGEYFRHQEFRALKPKSILVTNTKFTTQAIKYAQCVGVELVGWRYPQGGGLERLIENEKLYPITILPSLRGFLFNFLAARGLVLIDDLLRVNPEKFARGAGVTVNSITNLQREAQTLK